MSKTLFSTLFLLAFTLLSPPISAAQTASDHAVLEQLTQLNSRLSLINQTLQNAEPRMTAEQIQNASLCMFEGKVYSAGAALSSGGLTQVCTLDGAGTPSWKLKENKISR